MCRERQDKNLYVKESQLLNPCVKKKLFLPYIRKIVRIFNQQGR